MSETLDKCAFVKPILKPITEIQNFTKGASITHNSPDPKIPLPPLVSAMFLDNVIHVDVTCYVNGDHDITLNNAELVIGPNLIAGCLPVYVVYDFTPSDGTTYWPYSFRFKLDYANTGIKDLKKVEKLISFSWNDDPETSRGTETTVQDPIM